MRSMWNGALAFGLVTFPISLGVATEERDISFRQVHRTDGGRIRFHRMCSVCSEEVPYADIAKGYELPDGEMIVLTEADMADLPLATAKTIEVLQFTPATQVDPMLYGKIYYTWPAPAGARAYTLLRDALVKSGSAAICRLALRTRESLGMLTVRDNVMVLTLLHWPDEIREPDLPPTIGTVAATAEEEKLALDLVGAFTRDFEPDAFSDGYRTALTELVEAKIAGRTPTPPPPPPAGAPGGSLADVLRASVAAQQGRAAKRTRAPRKPAAAPRKPRGKVA